MFFVDLHESSSPEVSGAVAAPGVVDRYMSAMLFALDDMAMAHENLLAGLQQAAWLAAIWGSIWVL